MFSVARCSNFFSKSFFSLSSLRVVELVLRLLESVKATCLQGVVLTFSSLKLFSSVLLFLISTLHYSFYSSSAAVTKFVSRKKSDLRSLLEAFGFCSIGDVVFSKPLCSPCFHNNNFQEMQKARAYLLMLLCATPIRCKFMGHFEQFVVQKHGKEALKFLRGEDDSNLVTVEGAAGPENFISRWVNVKILIMHAMRQSARSSVY